MNQTDTPTPAVPPAPVAAPGGPRERRIRFGHLTLAVALIVIGALGTTTLVALVAAEDAYLAVGRDVGYGARITDADLSVVRIGNPPGVDLVPAARRDRVVGNFAAVPLRAGTLLAPTHVTDRRHPDRGEARLGITLAGDRMPARPVRAGQLLLLIETGDRTDTDEAGTADGRTWRALVAEVGGDGSGNLLGGGGRRDTTLDVIVPARDAPAIASLAADNRLAVAVLPGQPEG